MNWTEFYKKTIIEMQDRICQLIIDKAALEDRVAHLEKQLAVKK